MLARMKLHILCAAVVLGLLALGCQKDETATPKPAVAASAAVAPRATASSAAAVTAPKAAPAAAAEVVGAKIGEVAPDFTLSDLEGNEVQLSSFKGKPVVLEWFNPECPYVNLSHTKGSLVDTAARHSKDGVVWLAINSGAPGKQGHGVEKNREGKVRFNLEHPILSDADGKVGRAYGAQRTPHLFVIDKDGKLVYRGAIDNSPDAEKGSPQGGTLINYVDAALASLAKGEAVATPFTQPYGCSVKYGDS
jgi:peroxiredoxin